MWRAIEHSDQDNLRWAWLRAIGRIRILGRQVRRVVTAAWGQRQGDKCEAKNSAKSNFTFATPTPLFRKISVFSLHSECSHSALFKREKGSRPAFPHPLPFLPPQEFFTNLEGIGCKRGNG